MKISVADVESQLEMDEQVANAYATSVNSPPTATRNNTDAVKVIASLPPEGTYGLSEFTPLRLVPLSQNSAVGTYRTWQQVKSQVSNAENPLNMSHPSRGLGLSFCFKCMDARPTFLSSGPNWPFTLNQL